MDKLQWSESSVETENLSEESVVAKRTICDYITYVGEIEHVDITNKNALTENKPPPIQMIRISDFGLPDPKRDPYRHQNCIAWSLSHALPLQKI